MLFQQVAEFFEQIEQESSRLVITELLAQLFKKATPAQAAIIAYCALGNLSPDYKQEQFNFAAKSMLKVVAKLLDKTPAAVQAALKKRGDLGLVVVDGWEREAPKKALSVSEVNNSLHAFLAISGTGSQESKEAHLLDLFHQLDSLSVKYVVRIILGKLRLGFSEMTLLDAFSWMQAGDKSLRPLLEDAYNVSADIGFIIKILKEEGTKGLESMPIVPGIPVRPAAAERLPDAAAIIKKMGHCVAQPKLDGFRLQVHIQKHHDQTQVHFFSRNLQDMSGMFPELAAEVKKLKVKELVAEGEAIGYDVESGQFLPFQETVKRKRKYGIEEMAEEVPLKLYFFDILQLNGKSLLDLSHEQRRAMLEQVVTHQQSLVQDQVLFVIAEKKITTARQLEDYFDETVALGLEGLVVKRPDAPYTPGKRNFNWVKLKRSETGAILKDTIDCVILGYYAGHGKRAKFGIGALLVGVYNEKSDCFETVAKIGTGLTDEGWCALKRLCDSIAVTNRPHNVVCAKELYPDVWVQPQLVCEVRADEITRSPLHKAGATADHNGLALRFPRFLGLREDKSATDATSTIELKHMAQQQFAGKKK